MTFTFRGLSYTGTFNSPSRLLDWQARFMPAGDDCNGSAGCTDVFPLFAITVLDSNVHDHKRFSLLNCTILFIRTAVELHYTNNSRARTNVLQYGVYGP